MQEYLTRHISNADDQLEWLLLFLGERMLIIVLFALISFAFYIIQSHALYRMARRRGVQNAWLAYVPIVNYYTMGVLAGKVGFKRFRFNVAFALPVVRIVVHVFSAISSVWIVLYAAWLIALVFTLFEIFRMYIPERAILYTILSVIFIGIPTPFILFSLRNKEPIDFGVLGGADAPIKIQRTF